MNQNIYLISNNINSSIQPQRKGRPSGAASDAACVFGNSAALIAASDAASLRWQKRQRIKLNVSNMCSSPLKTTMLQVGVQNHKNKIMRGPVILISVNTQTYLWEPTPPPHFNHALKTLPMHLLSEEQKGRAWSVQSTLAEHSENNKLLGEIGLRGR